MSTGLGRLRLAPRDFWAMTPREFDAAIRGFHGIDEGVTAFTRKTLDYLLATFPDRS